MSEIIGRWTLNDTSTLYGEAGWHRRHDVYGGPRDEPRQETGDRT